MINVTHVIAKDKISDCPLCHKNMYEDEQVIVVLSEDVKALAHLDCTLDGNLMCIEENEL